MKDKFATFNEFLNYLKKRKLWWLIPMIIVFVIFGILILFVGSSPLAPIVYPLF